MKNFSSIFSSRNIILFLVLSIITLLSSNAQNVISGKVIDPMGEAATLVTVEVLNKANKVIHTTVTDMDGNYSFNLSHMKFETLRFSHLGFESMEINAHLPKPTVQMISSMKNIDDQVSSSRLGFK